MSRFPVHVGLLNITGKQHTNLIHCAHRNFTQSLQKQNKSLKNMTMLAQQTIYTTKAVYTFFVTLAV